MTSIELGAQSMDDEVLLANRRGHTSKDVEIASKLIKSYGFELGLQMMTGLYKDSEEKAIETAKKSFRLNRRLSGFILLLCLKIHILQIYI